MVFETWVTSRVREPVSPPARKPPLQGKDSLGPVNSVDCLSHVDTVGVPDIATLAISQEYFAFDRNDPSELAAGIAIALKTL